jgi:hypothetical protein
MYHRIYTIESYTRQIRILILSDVIFQKVKILNIELLYQEMSNKNK